MLVPHQGTGIRVSMAEHILTQGHRKGTGIQDLGIREGFIDKTGMSFYMCRHDTHSNSTYITCLQYTHNVPYTCIIPIPKAALGLGASLSPLADGSQSLGGAP